MKKLYQKFFYIPTYEKVPDTVFTGRTVLSVLSAVLCIVLLCSGTYAYFSDSVSSGGNTIRSVSFRVDVYDSTGTPLTGVYTCGLRQNDIHVFRLTASGAASTGYCVIKIEDGSNSKTYYTSQMSATGVSNMSLVIQAAAGSRITFVPQWGTSSNYASNKNYTYVDGDIILFSVTNFVPHFVVDGDDLEVLAQHYGVDVASVLAYNNIEALPAAGEMIRIPGTTVTEPPPVINAEEPDKNASTDGEGNTPADSEDSTPADSEDSTPADSEGSAPNDSEEP